MRIAEDTLPRFGQLLRRFRMTAGLTQEELAEQAGLSAHGISDFERGARTYPYAITVERLAEALGLAPHDRERLYAARHSDRATSAHMPDASMAAFGAACAPHACTCRAEAWRHARAPLAQPHAASARLACLACERPRAAVSLGR